MKTSHFLGAALLGLASSFSAQAQTPAIGTPGTPVTPGAPATSPTGAPVMGAGTVVPGQPGTSTGMGTLPAGTVPANATTPIGSSGQLYPAGAVPTRDVEGGTQRADQPAVGRGIPATTGGQPTRRLNRGNRSTTPNRVNQP